MRITKEVCDVCLKSEAIVTIEINENKTAFCGAVCWNIYFSRMWDSMATPVLHLRVIKNVSI